MTHFHSWQCITSEISIGASVFLGCNFLGPCILYCWVYLCICYTWLSWQPAQYRYRKETCQYFYLHVFFHTTAFVVWSCIEFSLDNCKGATQIQVWRPKQRTIGMSNRDKYYWCHVKPLTSSEDVKIWISGSSPDSV